MSENKKQNNKKKIKFQCATCQNYDRLVDYCDARNIEYCSKMAKQTDFSTCQEYLIDEKLVMF